MQECPIARSAAAFGPADYRAPWWQPTGHLQTLAPHLLDRPAAPPAAARFNVEVAPASAVRVTLSVAKGAARGTLLLVHGLAGAAHSRSVLAAAAQALQRGWAVARVDLRTCGGTAALSSTLYNAAQSDDLRAVFAELARRDLPRPFALLGFSLGGNLALRYAALEGANSEAAAVVAVSPPIDLRVAAATIEQPWMVPYRLAFTSGLCRLVRAVREVRPVPGPPADLRHVHGLREFDAAFTIVDGGWRDVDDYYAEASSRPLLGRIEAPTLILTAANDPVIDVRVFEGIATPSVRVAVTRSGGHVGYWTPRGAERDRFWAAGAALDFIEAQAPASR